MIKHYFQLNSTFCKTTIEIHILWQSSHFFGHSSSFSLVEIVASWASSTTSAGNTRDFGSFGGTISAVSLRVSLMGYLILVLIHVCTIGFLQRNATGMMVWYHQQYDISGMIEISTISHGRPMDVQHGPKMLVILATNFSISVTEKV